MRTLSVLAAVACILGAQIPLPVLGDVVISELMPNPASVSDELGEFFEITNISNHAVELIGCSFADITTSAVVSVTVGSSVVLQPGQSCAFIRDPIVGATMVPTGLAYFYVGCGAPNCTTVNNLLMGNSGAGDGIIFRDPLGQTLDVAAYGLIATSPYAAQAAAAGLPLPSSNYNGSSYERKDLRADWFLPGNVGPSTSLIPGLADHGTPGAINSLDNTTGFLRATTPPTIGTALGIQVLSPRHANLPRVLAASFGNTPFPLGSLTVELDVDALFWMSLDPLNGIFLSYGIALCGTSGESSGAVNLPPLPAIAGLNIYHHAVILDGSGTPIAVTSPLLTTLSL